MRLRDSASSTKPVVIPKRRPPSAVYWVLACLAPIAFFWIASALEAPRMLDPALRYDSAEWRSVEAPAPMQLPAEFERVALPHVRVTDRGASRADWYRLTFELGTLPGELWSLYVRGPQTSLLVYVNDELVGSTDWSGPATRARAVGPALIGIPAALLRVGLNRIDIQSIAEAPTSRMDRVYIGPMTALAPAFRRHQLFDLSMKQATVAAMLLFATLFAIIYALRRRDTVFAAYGATIFVWALHIWYLTVTGPWVGGVSAWRTVGTLLLGWFVVTALMTVHRFLGRRPRRLERALLTGMVAYSVGALLLSSRVSPLFVERWNLYFAAPVLLALGTWAVWQLARAAIANATIERRVMLACALLVWVVGLRDYLARIGLWGETAHGPYLPYTVSFVLITFGSLILFRFARALRETEVLNRELEARVAQKASELEANYARIRLFERDQALVAERARIMRDMHDGIGGQLVAAIALASRPSAARELDALLHEALDDLRMMIDSLESTEADLLTALGMLRMRVSNRFAAAGLEFRWQVTDVPRIPGFGPEQVLQVMRIVQEAFTNALKHASARTITVRTASELLASGAPAVAIYIEDDGKGIAVGERLGGRGLANMRRRAQSLGADLEIRPGAEGGTRVIVRLPLSGLASA